MSNSNPFTLAAEGSSRLLPLLRAQPALAASQDDHGYSLVHAAASHNQLDLLRTLIEEFYVDPNIKDEDGESALFVVETVEAARLLIEDLGANPDLKNDEGSTAEEKIQMEGDFTTISDFLRESRNRNHSGASGNQALPGTDRLPPLPPNIKLQLGTLEDEQSLGEVADPGLKQRIEELASRGDFQSEEGQKELRDLITDAVRTNSAEDRSARQRRD